MSETQGETRIEHPNRKKASSKLTRLIVVVLLLASAGLLAIITWGGWGTLEGAKPLQVAYIAFYLLMAFFVLRWNRGVLPLVSALAIIMFGLGLDLTWADFKRVGRHPKAVAVALEAGLVEGMRRP